MENENKSGKGIKRAGLVIGIIIGAILVLLVAAYFVGMAIYDSVYVGPMDTSVNTNLAQLREILLRDGEYNGTDFTPEQVSEVMSGILLEQLDNYIDYSKDYKEIDAVLSSDVNADLSRFSGEFSAEQLEFFRKLYIYGISEHIKTLAEQTQAPTKNPDETIYIPPASNLDTDEPPTPPETTAESKEPEQTTDAVIETTEKLPEIVTDEDVYNVLLLGTDANNFSGRSDTIILVSINKVSKRIILTSFMRDMKIYDPNYGWCKINTVYARKGTIPVSVGRLAVVLNDSFKMPVDNFVVVDFNVFDKVLNILGGVEVPMYYCEWAYMRNFTSGANLIADYRPQFLGGNEYGTVNVPLNASQALVYARMRKGVRDPITGNYMRSSDRFRNERQRTVISGLFNKIKTMNFTQVCQIAKEVLACVQTDVKYNDFLGKMVEYMYYSSYRIEQLSLPLEGEWYYEDTYVVAKDNDEIARVWREFVYK